MNIRWAALAFVLVILVGCVQIPGEELAPSTVEEKEEAPVHVEPVQKNETTIAQPTEPEQKPSAPLPELNKTNTSATAAIPSSVPANPSPQKQSQSGWTTESLSISEGETKYIYIK